MPKIKENDSNVIVHGPKQWEDVSKERVGWPSQTSCTCVIGLIK